jgi:hypothetical protein
MDEQPSDIPTPSTSTPDQQFSTSNTYRSTKYYNSSTSQRETGISIISGSGKP